MQNLPEKPDGCRHNSAGGKMDKQTEKILSEILEAIETGTAEANSKVENSTSNLDLRALLVHTGEMYAGHVGMAICKVIKKYTEGEV